MFPKLTEYVTFNDFKIIQQHKSAKRYRLGTLEAINQGLH